MNVPGLQPCTSVVEIVPEKLFTDFGNKEDIVPLRKSSRIEHTRPILKRRTKLKSEPISDEITPTPFIRPVLQRRKTSTPISQSRSNSNEPMRQKQCTTQRPILKRRSKTTKPVEKEVKINGQANKPIAEQQEFTFRPILKRRSKLLLTSDPTKEKKEKEAKRKKINIYKNKYNININLLLYNNLYYNYNNKRFLDPEYFVSCISKNLNTDFRPVEKIGDKDINTLSTKEKRSRLNYQEDYNEPKPTKKPIIDGKPTKATLLIFKAWDKLASKNTKITSIGDKRINTKKYRDTCSVVKSFVNGTLLKNILVTLPDFADNIKFTKNTSKDFEQCLCTLETLFDRRNKNYRNFKNKIDLFLFVAGHNFLQMPSILLQHCWEESENFGFNNEEYFPVLKDTWEDLTDTKITMQDRKNFDTYLEWGLPHFKSLKKGLVSMNDFDDELDVLEFFTFGVLRQMKKKGRSFSSGILNQEFFKVKMEELRKFHRFTV